MRPHIPEVPGSWAGVVVALLEAEPTPQLVAALDRWARSEPFPSGMRPVAASPALELSHVRELQRIVRRINQGMGASVPVSQVLIGIEPADLTVRGRVQHLLAWGVAEALRERDAIRRCDDDACPYGREGPRWFVRRGKTTNCSAQCRRRKANRKYYAANFGTQATATGAKKR
jgi:hypothetical protein